MADIREPTRDEITRLAYAIYLLRGCEPGRDVEDLVESEQKLCDQQVRHTQTTDASRTVVLHVRPVWFDKSSDPIGG